MQSNQRWNFWRTAVAGLLLQALGMGMVGVYGFYINPVAEHFAKSMATVNSGLAVLLLISAFASPLLGKLIDRSNLRPIIAAGALSSTVGLLLISVADEFYLLTLGFAVFSVGIVLYGPLVGNLLLVRAYQSQRVRALAIAAAGVSLASIFLPLLVAQLMVSMSWRESLQVLAAILFCGVLGSAWFVVKEPPRPALTKQDDAEQSISGEKFWAQKNFWVMGLATAILMSLMALLAVLLIPHFLSVGFSTKKAAMLISSMGIAGLIGKISLATISDRIRPYVKWFAVFLASLQLVAWALLSSTEASGLVTCAALIIGFTNGLSIPLLPYINSLCFSEKVLGQVNGLHMAMMLPFSLVGPWLAGRHFDLHGSYAGVFAALSVASLVVVSLLVVLRVPKLDGNADVG